MKRVLFIGMIILATSYTATVSFAQKEAIFAGDKILACQGQYQRTGKLTEEDEVYLSKTSADYNINCFKLETDSNRSAFSNEIYDLLKRVDIIPVKLVMAQAICESAWGKSYFAKHELRSGRC